MSGDAIWQVTILGCGSSGGVPRPDGNWGVCDPTNPKNRRRRCSILVEYSETKDLFESGARTITVIDTSPDFREQMLSADVKRLDAVIYTHDHADQTHGIDDLRPYVLRARERLPVWMISETANSLTTRFKYVFESKPGSPYPSILEAHDIPAEGEVFKIDGPGGLMPIQMVRLEHGSIIAAGYKVGPFAYSPDVSGVPDTAFDVFQGVSVWIVDALRETPHPTHASVSDALEWLERANPDRGVLTNLHVDLDYEILAAKLPAGIEPAYDGMRICSSDLPTV